MILSKLSRKIRSGLLQRSSFHRRISLIQNNFLIHSTYKIILINIHVDVLPHGSFCLRNTFEPLVTIWGIVFYLNITRDCERRINISRLVILLKMDFPGIGTYYRGLYLRSMVTSGTKHLRRGVFTHGLLALYSGWLAPFLIDLRQS